MMLLSKEFNFSAGHKLRDNEGKPLYGRDYRLRVTLSGKPDSSGKIIDIRTCEKIINDLVINKLNRAYLNDFIPQPTVENVAKWIWDELIDMNLHEIRLWENKDTFVTYNGD